MECPIEDGSGEELMVAYCARTLDPEREARLERHLGSCAKCRDLARAQRELWSMLDAWPKVTVPASFDDRLFQRITREESRAPWRDWLSTNWSWRPAVPVGVACAALVAAFLLKTPAVRPEPPKPQIEQVEHALDDMEMLSQLGVEKL
jgi:anti-sigma factor RsiW